MYGKCFKMKKAEIWSHGFGNERINDLLKQCLGLVYNKYGKYRIQLDKLVKLRKLHLQFGTYEFPK